MTVTQDKFVSLIYELRENDINGNIIEVVKEDNALSFVFGKGQMLPKFEENINGLNANDKFDFGIDFENAYGPKHEEAKAELPVDLFKTDGKIDEKAVFVDNVLPMQDNDGNVFYGKILEIGEEKIKMDFNHPLAGVNLYFSGKLIEVRDATQEEMNPPKHEDACGCGC